ncbi:hypothetical protein LG3211_2809 [Lysobacter gummosus]|nr:hypothetical protein LG3211_2809 [Lysobacter gummosus]
MRGQRDEFADGGIGCEHEEAGVSVEVGNESGVAADAGT